jgi:hypothetical protein
MTVDGTLAITEVGTESGTEIQSTTTPVDDEIVTKLEAGSDETKLYGTTTGLENDVGTYKVAGTETHDDSATVTTADDGTEAITLFGTLFGTSDH